MQGAGCRVQGSGCRVQGLRGDEDDGVEEDADDFQGSEGLPVVPDPAEDQHHREHLQTV